MTTIVTRAGKGSPLTNTELDTNFTNLNTDKLEVATAASTYQPLNGNLTAVAAIAANGFLQRTGVNTWSTTATIGASVLTGAMDGVTVGLTTPAAARVITLLINASTFSGSEILRVGGGSYLAGLVGIQTPTSADRLLAIGSVTHPSGATTIYGVDQNVTAPSTATATLFGFNSTLQSAASAFTLTTLNHFSASTTTVGVGSTVTNVRAFYAANGAATGTNNYGFYSDISSGATTWQLYLSGSARSWIAGPLDLSTTSTIGWGTAGTPDTALIRDGAAGIVALKWIATANTLRVYGSSSKYLTLSHNGTDALIDTAASSGQINIGLTNASSVQIGTRLGVGGAASTLAGIYSNNANAALSQTSQLSFDAAGAFNSTTTFLAAGFYFSGASATASYTLTDAVGFAAASFSKGTGSTITNVKGFWAQAALVGAGTNNYGFFSDIASAGSTWAFYASGTAASYFGGLTTFNVGTTTIGPVTFKDATDSTKVAVWDMSAISSAATRTYTLPDATDTIVLRTLAQTLTNKTLTAPIIATISNTGTLTLPTSTDTLVGRATTDTLTNKSISGSTNTLTAIANASLTNSSVTLGATTVALGTTASSIASLALTSAAVTSSTVDSTTIGATTRSTGAFTYAAGNTATTTTDGHLIAPANLTGTTPVGFHASGAFASTGTTSHVGFQADIQSAVASYTVTDLVGFVAGTYLQNSGSTVTNAKGFWAKNALAIGTNNYGFYSDINSGSNIYAFYGSGTAQSLFGGSVRVTGQLALNNAPLTNIAFYNLQLSTLISASQYGTYTELQGSSAATTLVTGFGINVKSNASAITLTDLVGYDAGSMTKGAGSTITNAKGFWARNAIAIGTNNYGFFSDINSATTTWQLYMAGTAHSRIAGGSLIVGNGALATSATDGFCYITTSAGAPTGVPTTWTGSAPIHIDSTNFKIYVYVGGAWKAVTVA